MQILWSGTAVAIYEVLAILALIILLIRQSRKNKDVQERKRISTQKKRNIQLEEMLKNPDIEAGPSQKPNPFEVQYMQEGSFETNALPKFQVEVEVHTETSVQRYLLDLDQEVTIGSDEKNILPLNDKLAAKQSCALFVKNRAVYVRKLSLSDSVCIQRGKKRYQIQNHSVKLQSKDILTLGKTALHVSIYEN